MNDKDDSAVMMLYTPNLDGVAAGGGFPGYASGGTVWVPLDPGFRAGDQIELIAKVGTYQKSLSTYTIATLEAKAVWVTGATFIELKQHGSRCEIFYKLFRSGALLDTSTSFVCYLGSGPL
ncbi:hypothetical protein [Pseudomonas abieticivorans]|uniref:hypothetical protein n=1 Tax=Pseudomonas abieticivorans TaxID=2931382 RepID=UPI0020BFCCF4|nr:hypothetical protein [Pseudomonas sp. PIA16]